MSLLTIAIPTRNRSKKLKQLLENLYSLISDKKNIHICVVDNSDNNLTSKMISSESKFNKLEYFKNPDNKGLQYSVYRLIDLSDSKYTWILSDDEIILEAEFNSLVDILSSNNQDVILFNKHNKGNISGNEYISSHYYHSTGLSNTLIKTKYLKNAKKDLKVTNYLYPHTLIILKIASYKNILVYSTGFEVLKYIEEIKNYKFHTHFILALNLLFITSQALAEGVSKSSIFNMRRYGKRKLISKVIEFMALSAKIDYKISMYKQIKPYAHYFNISHYILLILATSGFVTILNIFFRKYKRFILITIINIGNNKRFIDTLNSSTHLKFDSSKHEDTYI